MGQPLNFSIIIPARDEEFYLPKCLESIKASFSQIPASTYEIIVIINRSTDNTESIARQHGCIVVKDESKNLSQIRNAGAAVAKGEVLVTVDADSWLSVGMMREINTVMQSKKFAGGGVLILPERWSPGIVFCGLLIGVLALWYRVTAGLFFCSKTAFESIGGFNEDLLSAEDIDFARRLKKYAGQNSLKYKNIFSAHIVTSCRKFDRFGDWYFLTRFPSMLRLLKGKDAMLANEIWYDFPRDVNSKDLSEKN